MKLKLDAKTIGLGILTLLVLFIAVSFIFQETTVKSELLVEEEGEQIFVDIEKTNFFADVVNFIKNIFTNTFAITIQSDTEVGESFKTIFSGKVESHCVPTSGWINLAKGSSTQKSWTISSTLPDKGDSYSYSVTYTPTVAGDYRFTHAVYGDLEPNYFGECYVPSETETKYCEILDSHICPATKVSQCYNYAVSSLTCILETKNFEVTEEITQCPSSYCEDWERSGSISGGDEYEQVCHLYGSAPECRETTDVNTKITCDDGYEKDGDRCEKEVEEVTCYQCSNGQVISDKFDDNCDSGWSLTRPNSCSVQVTCYQCNNEGQVISNQFVDVCDSGWDLVLPDDCVAPPPPPPVCTGIESFFDYENCSTKSYITLGAILLLFISVVLFVPFGKGGKK